VPSNYKLARHHVPLSVQADLLNAFDTTGVYNILSVFRGTHVIPPRTIAVRIRYSFGAGAGRSELTLWGCGACVPHSFPASRVTSRRTASARCA